MASELQQDEIETIDLGVSYVMAELELLRAEAALIEASYAPLTPPEPTTHDDLSPLGQRHL